MIPDRNTPDRRGKSSGNPPQAKNPKTAQQQQQPAERSDAPLSDGVGHEPIDELTLPVNPVAHPSPVRSQRGDLDSAQPAKSAGMSAINSREVPATETPPNPRELARDLVWLASAQPQKPYATGPTTSISSHQPYRQRFPKPAELRSDCTRDSFDAIFGNDSVKELLFRHFIAQAKYPDICAQFRIAPLETAMLVGLAGTGKSTLLRAAAREAGADCYTLTPAHVRGLSRDAMQQGMTELFCEIGRNKKPAVCVLRNFDQLDCLDTLIHEANKLRGIYAPNSAEVLTVATVSAPWKLAGNCSLFSKFPRLRVELPAGPEEREQILRLKLAQAEVAPDVDLGSVASAAAKFSGKDLAVVVERAIADQARRRGEARPISADDLNAACLQVTSVNSSAEVSQFNAWCGKFRWQ